MNKGEGIFGIHGDLTGHSRFIIGVEDGPGRWKFIFFVKANEVEDFPVRGSGFDEEVGLILRHFYFTDRVEAGASLLSQKTGPYAIPRPPGEDLLVNVG